jgi:hypothetical protein
MREEKEKFWNSKGTQTAPPHRRHRDASILLFIVVEGLTANSSTLFLPPGLFDNSCARIDIRNPPFEAIFKRFAKPRGR